MSSPTDADLRAALGEYDASLVLRAAASKASTDLVELDRWYRTDLRAAVTRPTPTALTVAQLGRLMDWKLARGKWRPKLAQLALSNPDALVASCTPPAPATPSRTALNVLCVLKGVGPATASAILALYDPVGEPFMSDEAYEAVGLGKAEYTVKGWDKFHLTLAERVEAGAWDGMEELEKACWSWGVQKKYGGVGVGIGPTVKPTKKRPAAKGAGDEPVDTEDKANERPSRAKKSKNS